MVDEATNHADGLVTARDIARMHNVTVRAVRGWTDMGCPIAQKGGGRGNPNLYDIAAVREWRTEHTGGGPLNLTEERAQLTRAQRQETELRVKTKLGELVSIRDVGELWADHIGAARSKLLALPTKLAPLVLSCTALDEAQNVIEELVREALEDVSGDGIPKADGLGSMEAAAEADG